MLAEIFPSCWKIEKCWSWYIALLLLVALWVLVAHDCNLAIGGQEQEMV